jgi:chromosome segregation ATPase
MEERMLAKRRATAQPGPGTDAAPADSTAGPAGLADEAAAATADAEETRTRAARTRAEAGELLSAAQAEAARIVREAEEAGRKLTTEAAAADREAAGLEERAGHLRHAGQLEEHAGEADERVADLEAERARLAEQAATLDGKLTGLDTDRQDAEHALTAARDAGDLDAITQAQARLTAINDLAPILTARRAAVAERDAAIGDGTGRGELADALAAAAAHRAELRRVLNILDPERPEAVMDDLLATVQAGVGYLAGEMTSKPPAPQQAVAYL